MEFSVNDMNFYGVVSILLKIANFFRDFFSFNKKGLLSKANEAFRKYEKKNASKSLLRHLKEKDLIF